MKHTPLAALEFGKVAEHADGEVRLTRIVIDQRDRRVGPDLVTARRHDVLLELEEIALSAHQFRKFGLVALENDAGILSVYVAEHDVRVQYRTGAIEHGYSERGAVEYCAELRLRKTQCTLRVLSRQLGAETLGLL